MGSNPSGGGFDTISFAFAFLLWHFLYSLSGLPLRLANPGNLVRGQAEKHQVGKQPLESRGLAHISHELMLKDPMALFFWLHQRPLLSP